MYHRKMEKLVSSVKNVKTLTLQEPSDDSKKSPPLPQVRAYSCLTLNKSTQHRTSQLQLRTGQRQRRATSTCGTSCSTAATPR
jgi:hypothetical protein